MKREHVKVVNGRTMIQPFTFINKEESNISSDNTDTIARFSLEFGSAKIDFSFSRKRKKLDVNKRV